jgi:hypothetical protein
VAIILVWLAGRFWDTAPPGLRSTATAP